MHTHQREGESRRASGKEWRRDTHALVQLLRGLGWAAGLPRPWTIYQILLLTLRTSGGKLRHCLASFPTNSSGHFLWHAQDAHVHFPPSPSHSLSVSFCLCACVCIRWPFSNLNSFMFYVHEVRSLFRVSSWTKKWCSSLPGQRSVSSGRVCPTGCQLMRLKCGHLPALGHSSRLVVMSCSCCCLPLIVWHL